MNGGASRIHSEFLILGFEVAPVDSLAIQGAIKLKTVAALSRQLYRRDVIAVFIAEALPCFT